KIGGYLNNAINGNSRTFMQDLLLKIALQMSHEDYTLRRERQRQGINIAKAEGKYAGKKPNIATHQRIIAIKSAGNTIKQTANLSGCSVSQVKRIWALHKENEVV
ncbi:recombinase family protein, partial [bacterium]|nr:recombinase family protein [bacterium]